MKLRLLTVAVLGLGAIAMQASADDAATTSLTTDQDQLSYTIGNNMGTNFAKNQVTINEKVFIQGLEDGLKGNKPLLTAEQQQAVIAKFQKEMMAKMQAQAKADAAKNEAEGAKYLKKVAKQKGVKKTADGLYYQVVTQGTGPKPTATDTVTVNYEGKLIDGKVFDSSYQRGKPVNFQVNQVIPGWTEALKLMPVGSTYMLYIPGKLAYGAQGIPGVIGPNSVLTFKVELLSIQAKNATAPSAAPATTK